MGLWALGTWASARFAKGERGANLVEYILLVALIALIVMTAVVYFRGELSTSFDNAGSKLSATPNP